VACAFLALGAVLGVLSVEPAEAHTYSNYFAAVWPTSSKTFYYDADFPDSIGVFTWRERMSDGRTNWPIADTGRPGIALVDSSSYSGASCGTVNVDEALIFNYIDGEEGAVATTCVAEQGSSIINARITIDSGDDWYVTDSHPIPSPYNTTHHDLEAAATHEFGHALGWNGHFSQADNAVCPGDPDNSGQQTMCPTIWEGIVYFRSTETHDRHTMDSAHNNLP
jgi:hypothetical protein